LHHGRKHHGDCARHLDPVCATVRRISSSLQTSRVYSYNKIYDHQSTRLLNKSVSVAYFLYTPNSSNGLAPQRRQKVSNKIIEVYIQKERRHCKKELKEVRGDEQRCARCLAPYCSKTCQQADWPSHKSTCQSNPPRRKDLTAPESFASLLGPCSDSTRALLSETLDWSSVDSVQAWTLSLVQAQVRAATWSTEYSEGIVMPPSPQWMLNALTE